ncbi:hypothetical protein ACFQ15_05795 [Sphingomonas hankookensis]|uniref:hypothetical protein n=1 Tax=Sphingomonas hankookensis TaxID=563996 RepID=UPI001F590B19|nr:hypothetical protein [Sphingomonas hankookensis]
MSLICTVLKRALDEATPADRPAIEAAWAQHCADFVGLDDVTEAVAQPVVNGAAADE